MKRCYLDSNLLIYYKDDSSPFYKETLEKLEGLIKGEVVLYISPLTLDEFLYVLKYGFRNKNKSEIYNALKTAVKNILEIPLLEIVNPPINPEMQIKIVEYMEKYNLNPRDAYHLLTMVYSEIDSFATFDNDFKKVFDDGVIEKA